MRAVVLRGQRLVVDEIDDPAPAAEEVLVRTACCGICGSDLHALRHGSHLVEMSKSAGDGFAMDLAGDVVMGHEFSAEVLDATRASRTDLTPGDLVVSMPVALAPGGFHQIGYSNAYPGGFGERMVLSGPLLLKVPNGLPPQMAAMTEPMAVGRHAVERTGILPGDSAIVLGTGPVGLAVIADLRLRGVETIVAADLSARRRELAAAMGASVVVDPRETPAIDAWRGVMSPMPAPPVIFEAVGVPGMIQEAMTMAPRGSRVLVVGVCMEPDSMRPFMGIMKELTLQFVLGYTPMEFAATLRSIAEGDLDVAPLITGTVGLDGVAGAFSQLASPDDHVKIVVEP